MRLCLTPFLLALTVCGPAAAADAQWANPAPPKDFEGKIELDIRDSEADWGPFTPKRAPDGAPNVFIILYDDTGLAA